MDRPPFDPDEGVSLWPMEPEEVIRELLDPDDEDTPEDDS
jgi:hypothetical protein